MCFKRSCLTASFYGTVKCVHLTLFYKFTNLEKKLIPPVNFMHAFFCTVMYIQFDETNDAVLIIILPTNKIVS